MKTKGAMFYIDWVEEKFLVYSFFVTIALISTQIFMRAVLNSSLSWSEELARYLFIWQCWLGVSYAERKTGQIKIDFLRDLFSITNRRHFDIVATLITLATAFLLIFYGTQLSDSIMDARIKSTALRIPMYLIYASMPVGCLLFSIRKIVKLIRLFQDKEEI